MMFLVTLLSPERLVPFELCGSFEVLASLPAQPQINPILVSYVDYVLLLQLPSASLSFSESLPACCASLTDPAFSVPAPFILPLFLIGHFLFPSTCSPVGRLAGSRCFASMRRGAWLPPSIGRLALGSILHSAALPWNWKQFLLLEWSASKCWCVCSSACVLAWRPVYGCGPLTDCLPVCRASRSLRSCCIPSSVCAGCSRAPRSITAAPESQCVLGRSLQLRRVPSRRLIGLWHASCASLRSLLPQGIWEVCSWIDASARFTDREQRQVLNSRSERSNSGALCWRVRIRSAAPVAALGRRGVHRTRFPPQAKSPNGGWRLIEQVPDERLPARVVPPRKLAPVPGGLAAQAVLARTMGLATATLAHRCYLTFCADTQCQVLMRFPPAALRAWAIQAQGQICSFGGTNRSTAGCNHATMAHLRWVSRRSGAAQAPLSQASGWAERLLPKLAVPFCQRPCCPDS